MTTYKRTTAIIATVVSLALVATACSSSKSSSSSSGGTLYYATKRNVEHWDPQRMYIGRDLANASRLFYRNLTMLDPENKLVSDLATDTGTPSADNKTWTFTLKDGPTWQDGSKITCADFQYGISRTFATDVIEGGPNYAIQFLDIPTNAQGGSVYSGPYTKKNQDLFDKAVTCAGQTLTFHLSKPVGDFNYAVSGALAAFAPFKESQDKGAQSNFSIFSSGPYELQGDWKKGSGGTFVRNPNYNAKTDNTSVRKALPDKIVWQEGVAVETVFDRLLANAGNDQYLVTDRTAPPAYAGRVKAQTARATNPQSPYVDYLLPNFKRITNPKVLEALAIATDRTGWITATGGTELATPAQSIINPSVAGYKKFDNPFGVGDSGDPAKAKALLTGAGVTLPYPIHFTYSGGTPTTDAQASSLKAALEKAGFSVTLEGLSDTYYDVVQNPSNAEKYDLTWAGWGADWPNASTVIPPLFDSRINLTATSNGQDYGLYQNDATNAAIDKAYNETDTAKRNAMWGDLSLSLAKQSAYIPLVIEKFLRLHGSKVTNYTENAATNGFPDLGQIGVAS